jgi:hypothetical protein
MPASRFQRIFIIAGILSLFASYLGIWSRFIQDPVERTGSDFIAFYAAGRVAGEWGPAHVYEPDLQQQIQQEVVGFSLVPGQVLLYNHLPFLIPVLQAITDGIYVGSFYRWVVLLLLLYITALTVLSRILQRAGVDRFPIFLTSVSALLFLPVFFSLMNGQDTALLFLGIAVWMYGLLSGKEYVAGLGLSLATVRPHIALVLAIATLFRSPRAFSAFALGAGFLAVLSFLILGQSGTREFIDILFLSAGGEWYGMKEFAMYNLIGLLTRAMPQARPDIIRLVGWIVFGISILALGMLWSKTRHEKNPPIGISVLLALFIVPHLHFHDLALMLFPIYEWIARRQETGNVKTSIATALPVAISLLLLLSNISPTLQYTVPYLMMLALAVYPYYSRSSTLVTRPRRS